MSRGGSHPCQAGCTCARHPGGRRPEVTCLACGTVFSIQRSLVGKQRFCSPECHIKDYQSNPERQRRRSEATHAALQNLPQEIKLKRNRGIAAAKTSVPLSESHKAKLAEVAQRNWEGGTTGDAYAVVLCPIGFIREHHVHYGDYVIRTGFGLRRKSFNLDFAHVEGKVNIELDGPRHKSTPAEDAARDAILRSLGWRIIRIKHA